MRTITKKSEALEALEPCLEAYVTQGVNRCANAFRQQLLEAKAKFPLLEFCASKLNETIAEHDQIPFCDQVAAFNTIGGNVILGIMLQKRLSDHLEESFNNAVRYIGAGKLWYASDIIGERVFGFSLLTAPEKTIPHLGSLLKHDSNWVVRSIGAGCHYAIKKGLDAKYVAVVFQLLLSKGNATDREVRAGIGWAAKTTAKFHPDIIGLHKEVLDDSGKIGTWFKRKVMIGLQRNRYAKRN